MNNVAVPVDIEDVKQACMNYSDAYNLVEKVIGDTLKTYEETIIKLKLFGFIPWFNTTQFDKMNFYGKYTRPFALGRLKSDTMYEISKKVTMEPLRTKINNIVHDYFDYNFKDNKYRCHVNQYTLFLELMSAVNNLSRGYNVITPATLVVSQQALDFVNNYKNVEI